MLRKKLAEFAEYTSLHGINRMTSNKRVIGRVLWCAVILVCLGFCTRQIYMLCDQFARKTVLTMISIRQRTVRFPDISLCNLNPFSFNQMWTYYGIGIVPYFRFANIANYRKAEQIILSTLDESQEDNITIGFSRVFQQIINGDRRVRQGMNYYKYKPLEFTLQQLRTLNPDIGDFVISCIFEDQPCKPSSFVQFFDKHYGLCYRYSSESVLGKLSGPLFGLQLVIDVNQSDYLHNLITNAGIRLSIHRPGTKSFLQNNGMSVATGLQTDIALVQKTLERFSGSALCDESTQFNSIVECHDQCRLKNVLRMCNCTYGLEEDHIPPSTTSGQKRRCFWHTDDFRCIEKAFANLPDCNCLSPCSETMYEKTVTTSRWPARNFEPTLEKLYQRRGLNYSDYKDSLLAVNIYLESLSEEIITEEPAFTEENLMSNIGGSFGLWIGMSIISMGEILELLWILCSTALKRRRITTTVLQSDTTKGVQSENTSAQSDNTHVAQPENTSFAQSNEPTISQSMNKTVPKSKDTTVAQSADIIVAQPDGITNTQSDDISVAKPDVTTDAQPENKPFSQSNETTFPKSMDKTVPQLMDKTVPLSNDTSDAQSDNTTDAQSDGIDNAKTENTAVDQSDNTAVV